MQPQSWPLYRLGHSRSSAYWNLVIQIIHHTKFVGLLKTYFYIGLKSLIFNPIKRKAEYRFYSVAHVLYFHKNMTLAKSEYSRISITKRKHTFFCLNVIFCFTSENFTDTNLGGFIIQEVGVKLGWQGLYE